MTEYVVVGMHRSGTSMVSSFLQELGVNMGEEQLDSGKEGGYGEDIEFLELNKEILRAAGGDWKEPPTFQRINEVGRQFSGRIKNLVETRNKKYKKWGWKDPRNCLTAHLYHPFLLDPKYVYVSRNFYDIDLSLNKRNGEGSWISLAYLYTNRFRSMMTQFDYEIHRLRYEEVVLNSEVCLERLEQFALWVNGSTCYEELSKLLSKIEMK